MIVHGLTTFSFNYFEVCLPLSFGFFVGKCYLLPFLLTVCNIQSMKTPVELNSLLSKFFCFITWFVISPDYTRYWTTCKRDLYVKSYCFFETILNGLKITNWNAKYSKMGEGGFSINEGKPHKYNINIIFGQARSPPSPPC